MSQHLLLIGREPARLRDATRFADLAAAGWTVTLAVDSAEANRLLDDQEFGAVVADVQLPDATGSQVLDNVLNVQPGAHRFLLANFADGNAALKSLGSNHAFLSAPCDGPRLVKALERSRAIDSWLGNDSIRRLMAEMNTVFSPPFAYFQITKELSSPSASIDTIGAIVRRDPALSGKLLQLVNSSSFGLKRQVADPADAVMFLGMEATKSLVLLAHSYSHFDNLTNTGFSVEELWHHSVATGCMARSIAECEFAEETVIDQAFTAGLIHDLGKLLLTSHRPDTYLQIRKRAREGQVTLWEAEQEAFGATHAEVGAWLAATWGLPLGIVEAVALHHHPTKFLSQTFCPLTAVHVANALSHEQTTARTGSAGSTLDEGYLTALNLAHRIPDWRQACREASIQATQR